MILTLLLASITVLATPAAAAAPGVKIKFEIEYLFQVENPDSGDDGDYFPRVKIADGPLVTGPRIEDDEFEPFGLPEAPTGWTFTYENWPGDKPTVDITVAMWDYDSDFNSNSDRMDISPNNEDWELNLTYDLRSGTLSGDQLVFGTPCVWSDGRTAKGQSCIQGDGDHGIPRNNDGRITKIGITASAEMPDTDLDGIPDLIELSGIRNAAGDVLVDLPALGADPCRKTVILQLDHMEDAAPATRHSHEPKAGAITLVKSVLDAAPIPATSPCPYAGPHRDGIDFIYREGTQLAEQAQMGLNTNDFRNARTANFPAELAPYAHYGIFAHRLLNTPGTSGQCCEPVRDNNKDFIVTLGDWRTMCVADFTADYGGDDMLQTTAAGDDTTDGTQIHVGDNGRCDTTSAHTTDVQVLAPGTGDADARVGTDQDQAGTILHELFHAMALRHGGNQNDNYKPNYVSVMNYFFQTGIPNSAPPLLVEEMRDWRKGAVRFGLSDGRLPPLPEGGLNETAGISDGADWTFWWAPNIANPANSPLLRAGAGNGPLNWNDNRTAGTNVPIIDTVNVPVNINDAGGLTTLTDHDDWPAIRFRAQSPDRLGWACSSWPAGAPSCGGAGGVEEELSFDTAIRQEMSFFNLYDPDLAIAMTVDKADAEPDDTLTYQVKLDNIGTGGATQTSVKDTPPTGDGQTRQVGQLGAGGTKTESFTYVIPCDTEDAKVLTNKAEVSAKDLAGGAEANTANNTATATTTVHAPKLTLDKSAPPTVNAGEAMTIDLKVTNAGSGT